MTDLAIPDSEDALVEGLKLLHKQRELFPRPKRRLLPLPADQRSEVLKKTNGRCHLCGGKLDADAFVADHVLSHAAGGEAAINNFLPAHGLCNGSRWFYSDEEFKWILRMGVWARTQIEEKTAIGKQMLPKFLTKEKRNEKWRQVKKERYTFAANA